MSSAVHTLIKGHIHSGSDRFWSRANTKRLSKFSSSMTPAQKEMLANDALKIISLKKKIASTYKHIKKTIKRGGRINNTRKNKN
jgi:hypothetical protein